MTTHEKTEPLPAEAAILEAWQANAASWIDAVRTQAIPSRRATDRAIIDAVLERAPERVLDIGCGEGWLTRALAAEDIACTGIDAVPALIEAAREQFDHPGVDFQVCRYDAIETADLGDPFDMAVCNFSLLGEDSATDALAGAAAVVAPGGTLIVQTLHPVIACGDHPYVDGWRTSSSACLGTEFKDDAPWYFRTLGRWLDLVNTGDWRLARMYEPLEGAHYLPASLLLIAKRQPNDASDDDPSES